MTRKGGHQTESARRKISAAARERYATAYTEEHLAKYHDAGYSDAKKGEKLGVSLTTVRNTRRRLGLLPNGSKPSSPEITAELREQITSAILRGERPPLIALQYGVKLGQVHAIKREVAPGMRSNRPEV